MTQKRSMVQDLRRATTLARTAIAGARLRKAHGPEQRERAQKALAALMADARGLPMKLGQVLAQHGGENDPFAALVNSVEPMPLSEVSALLETAWNRPINSVLQHIEESHAAASLGQVHYARLLDGRELAIKIQYPNIAGAIDSEMRILGIMPNMGPAKRWNFDLEGYKQNFRTNFERELDYLGEAKRQQEFGQNVRVEGLIVPTVEESLCTAQVLAQAWCPGERFEAVLAWPSSARQRIGEIILDTFLSSLFVHANVHGDPHVGNYAFHGPEHPRVVLMDYGCTIPIGHRRARALLKLIEGGRRQQLNVATAFSCFVEMGFDATKLKHCAGLLLELTDILLAPFLTPSGLDLRSWDLRRKVEATLGSSKWWFRSAGPADLFLLMRAFQGLAWQLSQLDFHIDWYTRLKHIVGDDKLAHVARWKIEAAHQEHIKLAAANETTFAEHLQIRVYENGENKVQVCLPASAAFDLASVIPEELAEQLSGTGGDLQRVADEIRNQGLTPRTLFELERKPKRIHIYLE